MYLNEKIQKLISSWQKLCRSPLDNSFSSLRALFLSLCCLWYTGGALLFVVLCSVHEWAHLKAAAQKTLCSTIVLSTCVAAAAAVIA
jgi:hypothetical protein